MIISSTGEGLLVEEDHEAELRRLVGADLRE